MHPCLLYGLSTLGNEQQQLKMNDTETIGNSIIQILITSYFPIENKLSSIETLSYDLKMLLQKPVVCITHVSETPQSK